MQQLSLVLILAFFCAIGSATDDAAGTNIKKMSCFRTVLTRDFTPAIPFFDDKKAAIRIKNLRNPKTSCKFYNLNEVERNLRKGHVKGCEITVEPSDLADVICIPNHLRKTCKIKSVVFDNDDTTSYGEDDDKQTRILLKRIFNRVAKISGACPRDG